MVHHMPTLSITQFQFLMSSQGLMFPKNQSIGSVVSPTCIMVFCLGSHPSGNERIGGLLMCKEQLLMSFTVHLFNKKVKTLPFSSSLRHVQKADIMLECEHCGRWLFLYCQQELTKKKKKKGNFTRSIPLHV